MKARVAPSIVAFRQAGQDPENKGQNQGTVYSSKPTPSDLQLPTRPHFLKVPQPIKQGTRLGTSQNTSLLQGHYR